MKKILSWFGEEVIIVLLTLIVVAGSYGPLLYQYLTPPPGKVFLGSFGFPEDFWANVHVFTEGRLGDWVSQVRFSYLLPVSSTFFVKPADIIVGQIARLVPIEGVMFFHVARLIMTVICLVLIYKIIFRVFEKKWGRVTAFLLICLATAWPGGEKLMENWTPISLFQRWAYYPHYLLSFVFLLLAIYQLTDGLGKNRWQKVVAAGIFGALSALAHPPGIISLYMVLPIYFILFWLISGKFKRDKNECLKELGLVAIFGVLSFWPIYFLAQVGETYPWYLIAKIDQIYDLSNRINLKELLLGLGPMAVLAIYGAVVAVRKGGRWNAMIAPWAVIYLIGFYLVKKIMPYSGLRLIQTPFIAFLGILAAMAIENISTYLEKRIGVRKGLIMAVIILAVLLPSYGNYRLALNINVNNFRFNYEHLLFATREKKEAIDFLMKNTSQKDYVIADPVNATLITALSGNETFVTIYAKNLPDDYNRLEDQVVKFFSEIWSEKERVEFLKQNRVRLVFWGAEEKRWGGKMDLPILEKVFENEEVTIFAVKD